MNGDRELLVEVKDVAVHFYTRRGVVKAVDGVNLSLRSGESLGLVGESGCGKTMTMRAIIRLVPPPGQIVHGQVLWKGEDVLRMSHRAMRDLRGSKVVVVPQDPMTFLNPVYTIGNQIGEPMVQHLRYSWKKAKQEAARFLSLVRVPRAEDRINHFPHEFSGGMRQRALIAMGLTCNPELIIADEPSTALDVMVQSQILELLRDVQQKTGAALILVTHDLALVAKMCNRMAVMYAGRIVEEGATREVFRNPRHPYTDALLKSIPARGNRRERLFSIEGQPPNPLSWPAGCRFAPRCPVVRPVCHEQYPPEIRVGDGHMAACWVLASSQEETGGSARD